MKKFTRQKSGNSPTADIKLDFGAAAAKVAHVFEPGDYRLRIESARVIQNNQNVLVALDLIVAEGGDRIDSRPLWVDGPNAGVGPYVSGEPEPARTTVDSRRAADVEGTSTPSFRNWPGWSLSAIWYSHATATAAPITRSPQFTRRCAVTRRTDHVWRRCSASLLSRGWRPFPGFQASKTPAMRGWPGLNHSEWDDADLVATIGDYQPSDDFCCCLAVQPEIVAIDLDIIDQEHAAAADRLADDILGRTPLMRIGFAPKQIRIYRSGDAIRSRKLHPLEIFSGTGQIIALWLASESWSSVHLAAVFAT